MDRTEHFIRSPRYISFHSTQTLDSTHLAIGPYDPMFRLRVHSATNGLLSCPENMFSIIRVDHFTNHRHINGTFLRGQPVDAMEFVRPSHAIRNEVPIIVAHVGDALGLFKPGFTFLQVARQCLAFFLGAFAFSDIGNYAHVLKTARAISSGMRNGMDVLDDAVGEENSMLDIQVHAVLCGTIPELSQSVPVLRVNSVEYQIECRIRFSCEAQYFVSLV